jgi:hypothetical protein
MSAECSTAHWEAGRRMLLTASYAGISAYVLDAYPPGLREKTKPAQTSDVRKATFTSLLTAVTINPCRRVSAGWLTSIPLRPWLVMFCAGPFSATRETRKRLECNILRLVHSVRALPHGSSRSGSRPDKTGSRDPSHQVTSPRLQSSLI